LGAAAPKQTFLRFISLLRKQVRTEGGVIGDA